MTSPLRLLDDPEVGGELQADLSALRDHPVDFDLPGSLARFEARLDSGDLATDADEPGDGFDDEFIDPDGAIDPDGLQAPEPSGMVPKLPPATAPAQAAGQFSAGKLLALLAIGAGAGLGALQLTGSEKPPEAIPTTAQAAANEPTPAPAAQTPAPAESPAVVGAEQADAVPDAQATGVDPVEPVRPRPTSPAQQPSRVRSPSEASPPTPPDPPPELAALPAPPPPSAAVVVDPLQREVAQLGEVRRALSTSPRRALELADRGHAEFRDGSLYQEREALALRALHALGDRDALEARGRAFLLRHPQSSFAREVEQMLAR